jgi:hypothetical protein
MIIIVEGIRRMRRIERRSTERIKTGYRTDILYGMNRYTCVIENISASGVNVLTDPLDSDIEFLLDESIELKFKAHTKETVLLKCKILWSSKIPPQNVRHRIGMKIVELPLDKFDYFL